MTIEKKSLLVLATIGVVLIASPIFVGTPVFSQDIDHWFRILEKHNFTPVAQTGQTVSYAPGDDGALQKGIPWPNPRFTDNGNGTVTDDLTSLIWLKNANCFGTRSWYDALKDCNTLASGSCDLTDGSQAGDWRLPNRKELESLMDFGNDTVLPFRPPFVNFGWKYWTSTNSWFIESNGVVDATSKEVLWSVWPVRDSK